MRHGIEPPVGKTLEELGTKVAQLRYDAMIVFLTAFIKEIVRQRDADSKKGFMRLSLLGSFFSTEQNRGIIFLYQMLQVSIPRMKEDIKKRPLLIDADVQ